MASTRILSFTDTGGSAQKIAVITIFRVLDAGSERIITTFKPTERYLALDDLATLQTEAGSLFAATEGGESILLNSIPIVRLEENGSGCFIFYQGGERVAVSESISVIEGRIDALDPTSGGNTPIEDPNPLDTLDSDDYYRIDTVGTYYIEDAAITFDATNIFRMGIKNVSGGVITIENTNSNTFYNVGGAISSFQLSDGEYVELTAGSLTQYDIN